jgi:hypothetical protein
LKLLKFTFKREAIWMIMLTLVPALVGLLVLLSVWLARH